MKELTKKEKRNWKSETDFAWKPITARRIRDLASRRRM
jgi:hypothetical protein